MKIHEYQAKQLFQQAGIPVPSGVLATTPDEVAMATAANGGVVAIKAQVHVGGRGKAGGIKVVKTPDDARAAAQKILGMDIKGSTVRKVWVENGSSIAREAYLGITLDRSERAILFIASAAGGIDIEEVAEKTPEKIIKFRTYSKAFPEAEARAAAGKLFADVSLTEPVLDLMHKLFDLFVQKDCSLAEINPLVLTHDGKVIALDGKLNFDDNALFRHPEIEELRDMDEENPNEILAKSKGLSYVQLDGDIGCMVNGAGLAMATMDMVKLFGGNPANFLDVGGSSNPEKVIHAFKIILSTGNIKAVMINIFGGITRCDDIARGILESFKQIKIDVPVVVRLTGTNAVEGLQLLKGSSLIPASTFAEAVRKVIVASGGTVVEEHNQ
jgi:succinyl-CoA synthetase beta subunit